MTFYLDSVPPRWRLARSLLRRIGFRYADRSSVVFSWMEIAMCWGLGIELIQFDDDGDRWPWRLMINLGWPRLYIMVPLAPRPLAAEESMLSWGFSWRWSVDDNDTLHLRWSGWSKVILLPWSLIQVRHEVQRADGSWAAHLPAYGSRETDWAPLDDGRHLQVFPYRYVLQSGTVQERQATVFVERREHRWKALRWLPWPRLRRRAIDVTFDAAVGDGTRHGGCTMCSYTMRPGETAEQALRRMERERRFR